MSAASVNRRRILSLWLPRLPTDRIRRQRLLSGTPEPTAPLIVAAKHNNALQISALDDAAEQLGLSEGLPLANARAVCPDIDVADADDAADAQTLSDIAAWCDRFTPLVALDPPHGLLLDVSGCAHLFGGEAAMLTTIAAALTRFGFRVSAAIAGTSVCARALTRYDHGIIVQRGREAAAISALQVSTLGAELAIVHGLRRAGLKTIGDVASRQRNEIAARFGADFMRLLSHALGEGDTPISPRKPLPDFIAEKRFAEPVATSDVITGALQALALVLIKTMDKSGKGARRLEASFFRTDGAVRTISVDAGSAITRADIMMRLFAERLDALADPLDPGFGFDLIRLAATQTAVVTPTQSGFDTAANEANEVIELADRLSARLGARRVVRYLPQDTHVPERAALAVPVLHAPPGFADAEWPARFANEPPLRPLRLFAEPEKIEVIFAEVPDKPPRHFNWRRTLHSVVRAEGPERIAMEWWRSRAPWPTRDYFRIEDQFGLRFWLYRDGLYGEIIKDNELVQPNWFLHGLFA